jgi:tetratricopeptide (TPR) repeat protein
MQALPYSGYPILAAFFAARVFLVIRFTLRRCHTEQDNFGCSQLKRMSEAGMKSAARWILALALLLLPLSLIAGQEPSFRTELDLGVAAYKNSHYEEAIQHFRKATELNPSNVVAHMYLATALVSEYIPGVDTPDNIHLAAQAIEQYQRVLDSEPVGDSKLNSAKGIAYLYLNMKKFDDSKKYYQMASGLDPNDPEPYYSMGVIDWTQCYQPRMEARMRLKMRPDEHLDAGRPEQKRVCDEIRIKNGAAIEEGIDNFKRAIQLRPDYDDAMAYMNLMYRERADVECDDPVARNEDLKTADEWVDKTLAVKKSKAEHAEQPKPQSPAER